MIGAVEPGDHLVQFYDGQAELARTLASYFANGAASASTIVICTPEHRRAFTAAGVEATTWLDAADTLAQLLSAGSELPDPDRFGAVIGGLVGEAVSAAPVLAYGEMVTLLWQAGNIPGAIALEDLWCDLQRRLKFALLCAYPSVLVSDHPDALTHVCHQHTAALDTPAEGRPAPSRQVTASFAPRVNAPRASRQLVRQALTEWGAAAALLEDATLLVSELTTNAILHAGTGVNVSVSTTSSGATRLEVSDGDNGRVRAGAAAATSVGGRGLTIIDAIAARWGVDHRQAGKTVWAELDPPACAR